jgi:hypothetical protein
MQRMKPKQFPLPDRITLAPTQEARRTSASDAPLGRPPVEDGPVVTKIVEQVERGVRLSVALAKFSKSDKDRIRRKVKRIRVETSSRDSRIVEGSKP